MIEAVADEAVAEGEGAPSLLETLPSLLSTLGDDELEIIFGKLFNPLEPRLALALSNTSPEFRRPSPNGARAPTQEARWQLRAQHEAAAALCHKVGMRGCKELRKAASAYWHNKGLSAADLERLGTLGSVLPALKVLSLSGNAADPDGVRRLAEGLGAGDLPALTHLILSDTQMGDAGAAALAAALSRGALPRIEVLAARDNGIGDAGLLALAPALRQRPTLEGLSLAGNPLGDEGLAALVALPPKTGALARLWRLDLDRSQIGNAGGAALAAALERGIMPALEKLLFSSDAAAAATHAHVKAALASDTRRSARTSTDALGGTLGDALGDAAQ